MKMKVSCIGRGLMRYLGNSIINLQFPLRLYFFELFNFFLCFELEF